MFGRRIRIAVTLLLVIASMIQPVSASAMLPQGDGQQLDVSTVCQACSCCSVPRRDHLCCCCGHAVAEEPISLKTAAPKTASRKPSSPKLGVSRIDVSGTDTSRPADSEHRSSTVCGCGTSAPPMSHGNHRDQIIRDLTLRLGIYELIAFEEDPPTLSVRRPMGTSLGSRADFSQRILCVWRI